VEGGGANECKSNGEGPSGRIEWNEIYLGVIIVYSIVKIYWNALTWVFG
jgi:hypothetical protein